MAASQISDPTSCHSPTLLADSIHVAPVTETSARVANTNAIIGQLTIGRQRAGAGGGRRDKPEKLLVIEAKKSTAYRPDDVDLAKLLFRGRTRGPTLRQGVPSPAVI